jgi:hypothetical protein
MPIEHREIILSLDELLVAIEAYIRVHPTEYPSGKVESASPKTAPDGVRIDARVVPTSGNVQSLDITLTEPAIIGVLTRFCLESNIPIPRAGRKSVHVSGDSISLKISLGDMEPRQ